MAGHGGGGGARRGLLLLLARFRRGRACSTASARSGRASCSRWDGYKYAGRDRDIRAKLAEVAAGLPTVERIVVIPYLADEPDISAVPKAVSLADFAGGFAPGPGRLEPRGPSSARSSSSIPPARRGSPKCIVHGQGGALTMNLKEHRLHADIRDGDRVFYFTTLGWMMWNWLLGGLAFGAALMLYDGSALPSRAGRALGTSPRRRASPISASRPNMSDAVRKAGVESRRTGAGLPGLRTILTTGSPLAPESYDYIYARGEGGPRSRLHVGRHRPLRLLRRAPTRWGAGPPGRKSRPRSSAWMCACSTARGRDVLDEKGELVCARPFPSMPVMFWKRPGRGRATARPISRVTPISGARATSPPFLPRRGRQW